MKNFKNTVGLGLLLVSAACLSSCGKKKTNPVFWTCFGSEYTTKIQNLVDMVNNDFDFKIDTEDHKSYDTILSNISDVMGSGDYPNLCIGYPDHFIRYEASGALVDLTDYIEAYDQKHGTDIMRVGETTSDKSSDGGYFDAYMQENRKIVYGRDGKGRVTALPFNKSTEVMAYNSVFVDFCDWWCTQNPNVEVNGKKASTWNIGQNGIPNTWQEWQVKGPYYRHIMDTLIGTAATEGKYIYGVQDTDGTAHDFVVSGTKTTISGKTELLHFPKVDPDKTRVMGWDDGSNMFITLIKQWGSHYTQLQDRPQDEDAGYRKGYLKFLAAGGDKDATLDCLEFFTNLAKDKIIGTPKDMIDKADYCTDAFKSNMVMFTVCSSGGVHKNIDGDTNLAKRMKVRAIPYYDDGEGNVRKIVISQGANIAMLDKGTEEEKTRVFEFMVKITSGKYQAKWCLDTGYFPCSVSGTNDPSYRALFSSAKNYSDKVSLAHREASEVNENNYMAQGWDKFVDDPFDGSAEVREEVKGIMRTTFNGGLAVLNGQGRDAFRTYCYDLLEQTASRLATSSTKGTIVKGW